MRPENARSVNKYRKISLKTPAFSKIAEGASHGDIHNKSQLMLMRRRKEMMMVVNSWPRWHMKLGN